MIKSYLRYEPRETFGVVVSPQANILCDRTGKHAIVPALENILIWNLRQGAKVHTLKAEGGQVSCLALSPNGELIAAGYSNGSVRVFKLADGSLEVTLEGHKSSVDCIAFKEDGTELATGSKDTDLILWDLVSQSGICRLRGHKDGVTCVKFLSKKNMIVSSSKDTLLKVWDIDTQHCVQTCVGHRSEIWSFDVDEKAGRIVTGSSDNQIRVWSIDAATSELEMIGSVHRQCNERVIQIQYNADGSLIACQGSGKNIEVFKIHNEAEIKKKMARRVKRQREKAKKKAASELVQQSAEEADGEAEAEENLAGLEFELVTTVRTNHKLRSFSFSPEKEKDGSASIVVGLSNNSLETYSVPLTADVSASVSHSLVLPGHRSDVRNVSVSSDDQLIMTVSSSLVKIWNALSTQCIRTLTTKLAICAMFAPGNRHAIVGTKEGRLQIYDLSSGQCIFDEEAHEGTLWSMDLRPDNNGIVTGGSDNDVKFWDFDMVAESEGGPRTLSLVHTRTLKMADEVLCVRFSHSKDPAKLLVAIALLDCTVKVFFDDSLKFFLSLYGHKLPVMSMDISSDDTLLATASADKNVKLWGLDYGDCHKSIFAHDKSIMSICFVKKTHFFFTASKDATIRYWDGDRFERILSLPGHFGEVWGVAISNDGSFLVSVSNDRSIRKWARTNDQVFIEEEREKEMEEMFDEELENGNDQPVDENAESAPAGKKSAETVAAGERIMQAIELVDAEIAVREEYEARLATVEANLDDETRARRKVAAKHQEEDSVVDADLPYLKPLVAEPKPNLMLLGHSPLKYMLRTIRGVRSHEMEEALLVLPFDFVKKLISYLLKMVRYGMEEELCLKCLLHLLRVHHERIVSNRSLLAELDEMWLHLRQRVTTLKDSVGFNLAGMQFLKRKIAQDKTIYIDSTPSKKTKAN